MIDPNWCFENPEKAAQEIQRLRELCEKAVEVADESQDWNWLDESLILDMKPSYENLNMQRLVDDLEEIKNAL